MERRSLNLVLWRTYKREIEDYPLSMTNFRIDRSNIESATLSFFYAAVLALLFVSASLVDDAFITFRTIDNFINGYGLTWNTAERVQSYTHPLWMFALSAIYWMSGDMYLTAILAAMSTSALSIALLVYAFSVSRRTSLLILFVLGTSQAFVDYGTSGLENPLTHLLFACFALKYANRQETSRNALVLSLIAALAVLNRMDTILLYLPSLYSIFAKKRDWSRWRVISLGFAPLVLWELFSLLYYGFPFPNTAYAKLQTNISSEELLWRGLDYLSQSLVSDPITCSAIAAGIIYPYLSKQSAQAKISLGVLMYVIYVVAIGGGYMPGRFLTAPFFASLCALMLTIPHLSKRIFVVTLATILVCNLCSPTSTLRGKFIENRGNFHVAANSLVSLIQDKEEPVSNHIWAHRGRQLHKFSKHQSSYSDIYFLGKSSKDNVVTTGRAIGLTGFYAGPRVHIIDAHAICDPLLARIPPYYDPGWTPGHLHRIIPEGYIETHVEEINVLHDARLKEYYGHLSIIIAGPIFDSERILTIIRMNLGYYNHLINAEEYGNPPMLDILSNKVRILPNNPFTRIELARGLFNKGEPARGLAELNKALRLNPASYNNHIIIGNMLAEFGLAQRALTVISRATEIEPNSPAAYIHLASILVSMGDIPQAISTYEKALALDPGNAALKKITEKISAFSRD